jgi:hypothetical protein
MHCLVSSSEPWSSHIPVPCILTQTQLQTQPRSWYAILLREMTILSTCSEPLNIVMFISPVPPWVGDQTSMCIAPSTLVSPRLNAAYLFITRMLGSHDNQLWLIIPQGPASLLFCSPYYTDMWCASIWATASGGGLVFHWSLVALDYRYRAFGIDTSPCDTPLEPMCPSNTVHGRSVCSNSQYTKVPCHCSVRL